MSSDDSSNAASAAKSSTSKVIPVEVIVTEGKSLAWDDLYRDYGKPITGQNVEVTKAEHPESLVEVVNTYFGRNAPAVSLEEKVATIIRRANTNADTRWQAQQDNQALRDAFAKIGKFLVMAEQGRLESQELVDRVRTIINQIPSYYTHVE